MAGHLVWPFSAHRTPFTQIMRLAERCSIAFGIILMIVLVKRHLSMLDIDWPHLQRPTFRFWHVELKTPHATEELRQRPDSGGDVDRNSTPPAPNQSRPDKVIVMAKLEVEDTAWVEQHLPE